MYSPTQYFISSDHQIHVEELFSCVLVVEPNPVLADSLTQSLQDIVGEIQLVESGAEALDVFQSTFLELLIVSSALTDKSAAELAATARYYRPGLPVLVTVPKMGDSSALLAMREGAWDYLSAEGNAHFCPQQLVETITRIAERKVSTMQEIEFSAERSALLAAMQTAQDGTAIVASSGLISQANAAFADFCQLLQPADQQCAPLNLVALIAENNQKAARELLTELRCHNATDGLWRTELTLTLPGEPQRVIELNLSTVTMNGNTELSASNSNVPELRRHVVWVRDLTARKNKERFEKEVISATTHDLKGPLGSISCAAELIEEWDCELPPEVRRLVQRIYSCARRSLAEIDTLLKVRALDAGALTVRPSEIALAEVFDEVLDNYLLLAQAEQIEIQLHPIAPGQKIYADKPALLSILGNLIGNAIKYTPRDGRIQLSSDEDRGMYRIAITDNGPGIDPRLQHRIFDPFVRSDEHSEIEGSGLGLYIAKNLVEAHGGRIDVQSYLGSGTSFILHFPLENSGSELS